MLLKIVLGVCLPAVAAPASESVLLNGTWQHRVDGQASAPQTVPFSRVPLESVQTFEKTFTLAEGACADVAMLEFDGVVGKTTVHLNGDRVGSHASYTPFRFDVSEFLDHHGVNELVVSLDDRSDTTTIPYAGAPWINYSGIYRDVRLRCGDRAVLFEPELQYDFGDGLSQVDGEVTVRAGGVPGTLVSFHARLLDGTPDDWSVLAEMETTEQVAVGQDGIASALLALSVGGLELWSPDTPRLYRLHVVVSSGGQIEDESLETVGFREVRAIGNDIVLNGEPLLLAGVSRHDIYPGTGFIGTEAQMRDDMTQIKTMGLNYVRLIHYPHDPYILDLADELGLLVSAEIPAWANLDHPVVRQRCYTMLDEAVRRDMLHPSLFLWIAGTAWGRPALYARESQERFRTLDRNRLVSFVNDDSEYTPLAMALDVAFHHEAGLDVFMKNTWWYFYMENVQDAWLNFPKDLPIVVAEFGQEGNDRDPVVIVEDEEVWWREQQQAEAIGEMLEAWRPHLPAYDAIEHITGMILFSYQDFGFPTLDHFIPNHVPVLHTGVVYADRDPKRVVETVTDFFETLPGEFVGLPTVDDPSVERLFGATIDLGPPVSGPLGDEGPSVTWDGAELYFASGPLSPIWLPRIVVARFVDGVWTEPVAVDLPPPADSRSYRRSPCISPDGRSLYFTQFIINGVDVEPGRIWRARREDGGWSAAEDLGDTINHPDPTFTTGDAFVSTDGETLYFCSDRPGGSGGTDLWFSRHVGDSWGAPTNLGPGVNSEHDESGPCVTADGLTLYFSSDRPGGRGNADVWVSRYAESAWTAPKNLGPEVNSPGVDRDPQVTSDGRRMLFTGIRSGGAGMSDIWLASAWCGEPGTHPGSFDHDHDGDVDLDDFGALAACSSGPGAEFVGQGCCAFDADDDGDVDVLDWAALQSALGRP